MKISLDNHYWKVDTESYLGFVSVNLYDIDELPFDLSKGLVNGILNENHFGKDPNPNLKPASYYGSLDLKKVSADDFTLCSTTELNDLFAQYFSEPDWGKKCLEAFKANKKAADHFLSSKSFISDKHYFLCKEWIDESKLTELDFFDYLVCTISPFKNKVAVCTYGVD